MYTYTYTNTDVKNSVCDACCKKKVVKMTCKPITSLQSKNVCELIYSDLCGPMLTTSIGESKYFITFADNFLRRLDTKCMKSKDQVKQCI